MMQMDDLLRYLLEKGGSDLHLMAGLAPAIRVNGALQAVEGVEPYTPESAKDVIYKILTADQIKRFEEHPTARYELDFAYGMPKMGRFRFNVHKQRGTIACVARAILTQIPAMDSLGLPPGVSILTDSHKGLGLVTVPTGSGKSTTLASVIDYINSTRAEHILTIEDPVEYIHNSKKSYVTQREVGEDADTMTFANALKYALRQDPDVILVGEMRDHETIGIALTSAETGHLVFGTLHTPSASQTIGRIIDVFPSDAQPQVITQLSSSLIGVSAQILLPTVDGKGRCAAVELMIANTAIKNLIRASNVDGLYQAIQTGAKEGMITMDQSILNLVRDGKIASETARPHLRDEVTKRQLEQMGGGGGGRPMATGQSQPAPAAASQPAADGNGSAPEKPKRGFAIPPWEKKQ